MTHHPMTDNDTVATAAASNSSGNMEDLDPISVALLWLIKIMLDDNGAWDWNPRVVGLVCGVVLFAIRSAFHKAHGIDWFSLVNAIVTGFGALAVIYLDVVASEKMTGLAEPLRAAQCLPPLTSLHRILPAMAMGYSVIDLIDGFTVGIDFLVHGVLTMSVMLFFCEMDRPQLVAPFIVMECSTIFLNLVGATFLSEKGSMIVQLLFALTFTITRIIMVPPIHFKVTRELFAAGDNGCDAPYFKWVVLVFGIAFNSLNAFWFYKIVRKMKRKLTGKEKMKAQLTLDNTTKKSQ